MSYKCKSLKITANTLLGQSVFWEFANWKCLSVVIYECQLGWYDKLRSHPSTRSIQFILDQWPLPITDTMKTRKAVLNF